MSVNLVLLKSGEEIIADVKEIKSEKEVIGYYFDQPFIVHYDPDEEPQILQESETTLKYNASVSIGFFPWIPFADDRKKIPCSADWIVTIVKPQEQLIKHYQEKVNGRNESDQSPIID